MKLVHKTDIPTVELLENARQAEAEGRLDESAKLYEKVLKVYPTDEQVYNRLMIIYRKLKEYKKEATVIKKGIRSFEQLYSSTKTSNAKIARLSKALLKSTGLVDKKGRSVYEHEPIAKWRKRLAVVGKKLD